MISGFICGPTIYEYKGWLFEYGPVMVWPLRKDWSLRLRAGRRFWEMIGEFERLPDNNKSECRVVGGCQSIMNTQLTCPRCGSHDIEKITMKDGRVLYVCQCFTCSHKWISKKEDK